MNAAARGTRRLDPLWRAAMRVAYRIQLAWWFVRRPVIEGSHVAVWHGERVLLIQNSYRRRLSLPAGGRKRGETMHDAAVRELREEVGIHADPERVVYSNRIVAASGYAEDHAHVFELHCDEAPSIRVDGREVVWAAFLTPDDALARGVGIVARRYLEAIIRRAPPPPPPRTTPPRASSAGSPSAGGRG